MRRSGFVLDVRVAARNVERERAVRLQVEVPDRGLRRPGWVGSPGVRAGLKRRGLPRKLAALPVQPVAEPRCFNLFPELRCRVVPTERNLADRVGLRGVPLTVEPRTRDDEVEVIRVAQLRPAVDFPRAPRIFLIPETGHVQVRDERAVHLIHPCLVLPELVVVGVLDDGVPVRDRAVEVLGVDVRERTEIEVPRIGVVGLEVEVGVGVLVGLFIYGVLERIALAQRAVAVIVVVHPLVRGRCLLRDRFQRRVRVQECHRRGEAIVGDTEHPHLTAVPGHVLDQPLDRIVRVARLARRFRILEIDFRRQLERALRPESPAQVLDHEDVAVLHQRLE